MLNMNVSNCNVQFKGRRVLIDLCGVSEKHEFQVVVSYEGGHALLCTQHAFVHVSYTPTIPYKLGYYAYWLWAAMPKSAPSSSAISASLSTGDLVLQSNFLARKVRKGER